MKTQKDSSSSIPQFSIAPRIYVVNVWISEHLQFRLGAFWIYIPIVSNIFNCFSFFLMFSFLQDLNALRDDLMELKPTLLAGVPRVFERIYEGA